MVKKEYYWKNKERVLEYQKKRYRENEKLKTWYKNYYKKNRERILKKSKEWKKSENGKFSKLRWHYKVRKKVPVNLSNEEIKKIKERDKVCVFCGSDKSLTFDHVDNNGPTNVSNLVVCCLSCNSSKGNKNVVEWLNKKNLDSSIIKRNHIN